MKDAEPMIRLHDVRKAFGEHVVLDGATMEVAAGESVAVLGASGSGKSVTLKHVNGLIQPDAGSVRTAGYTVSELAERELWPLRRNVSYLFQGGALFDSMSVFDNLAFPLREHLDLAPAELQDRVDRLLGMVRLGDVGHLAPSELSGGMRKRVALARALALEPDVILYDEPTTGLDPVTSRAIAGLMIDLRQRLGVTSVTVTHDTVLVERVAGRVVFLSGGRFIFTGGVDEARRSGPEEVRAFFGDGGTHA